VAQGSQYDPYRPPEFDEGPMPQAAADTAIVPATRAERLGAALIDGLVQIMVLLPIQVAYVVYRFPGSELGLRRWSRTFIRAQTQPHQLGWWVVSALLYLALHGYLLARSGQSIGKRLVGIRIVNFVDGKQTPFAKIVGLRVIPKLLLSLVPKVGGFATIIDDLIIFRGDRRCLHDHLAGTMVIKVPPPGRPGERSYFPTSRPRP
jgi:uncharacterized RDD family membrane protein YckC